MADAAIARTAYGFGGAPVPDINRTVTGVDQRVAPAEFVAHPCAAGRVSHPCRRAGDGDARYLMHPHYEPGTVGSRTALAAPYVRNPLPSLDSIRDARITGR